jgi:hypothetical protein
MAADNPVGSHGGDDDQFHIRRQAQVTVIIRRTGRVVHVWEPYGFTDVPATGMKLERRQ